MNVIKKYVNQLSHNNDTVKKLESELRKYKTSWPPGHFYSPIPSMDETKKREGVIWGEQADVLHGIDLRVNEQIQLLSDLSVWYPKQPWTEKKKPNYRYFFNNPNYTYGESLVLFGMVNHLQSRRIIEIGSGYSSCAVMDINEHFFNHTIATSFIEPYPDLLNSLLKKDDNARVTIIKNDLQDVETKIFSPLSVNDILLIDSTHVSKTGSDVNHILFNILPQLNSGVYIHFHDIYYPFEYPKEWVYQGRAWNEAYILKAFLQFNRQFEIVYFNSYMHIKHNELLENKMPLCAKHGGSSLWIRKI